MLCEEIQEIVPVEGVIGGILRIEGKPDYAVEKLTLNHSWMLCHYKDENGVSRFFSMKDDFVHHKDAKGEFVHLAKIEREGNVYRFFMSDGSLRCTLEITKVKDLYVQWTGFFPNLCYGKWKLFINGEDCSEMIPEDRRNHSMYIEGASVFDFDLLDDGDALYEKYKDGLSCEAWIEDNREWLVKLPIGEDRYGELYDEFAKNDFIRGCCGGCR